MASLFSGSATPKRRTKLTHVLVNSCADPEGVMGDWTPLKNHTNIRFLSNSGLDPLQNLKATRPAMLGHH